MDENKLDEITSKLELSPNVVAQVSKKSLFKRFLYPIVQFGVTIVTNALNFLVLTIVSDNISITYPENYYLFGAVTGTLLNGTISTVNLVTCGLAKNKLNVERKRTIFLGTLINFLFGILVYLLIWREKVKYPVYPPGTAPKYGVFS